MSDSQRCAPVHPTSALQPSHAHSLPASRCSGLPFDLFFLFSTDDEIQEMIDEADRDNDGKINAEEFFRVMKKRGDNPLDDWDSDED